MMRLKLFSTSLAKSGLLLWFSLCCIPLFSLGCSSSTKPTYHQTNIEQSIEDIAGKEYHMDLTAKLLTHTLWIYVPVEDLRIKADPPEKFTEKFVLEHNDVWFQNNTLNVTYLIKNIPTEEQFQDTKLNKAIMEKLNNILKILLRVTSSLEGTKKKQLHFFCLVMADIKSGAFIRETIFQEDFKKVFYNYISQTEFLHRIIQEGAPSLPMLIGNKTGNGLTYWDITLPEFLAKQIQQRIQLKFSTSETPEHADIEKEIRKVTEYTLTIYGFKDFDTVGFYNMATNNKVILSRTALFEGLNK